MNKHITPLTVIKEIKQLKTENATSGPIPIHILKLTKEISVAKLSDCFNNALNM